MRLTVAEFRERVLSTKLDRLLDELSELTGRSTKEERSAWVSSFTRLAEVLDSKSLSTIHLYLGDLGNLSVEYRLPASSSWCDLVLLGHNGQQPTAVILELKHWDTRRDKAVAASGLIETNHGLTLHPAEQVRGYVEYCERFHSAVDEAKAVVNGCVLFTAHPINSAYTSGTSEPLVKSYPCFSLATEKESAAAINYLNLRLTKSDPAFAHKFETGHYRQNRSFIQAIGDTLRRSPHKLLVLLDEQRKGLFMALDAVNRAIAANQSTTEKRVVIVEGPPGSGKSAVAAHLWAELAANPSLPAGDLAFVTTSAAQNHSLEHLFGTARGAVKKASQFTPATTHELGRLKKKFPGQFDNVSEWRNNLALLRTIKGELSPRDDAYLVSVIDEAHALINPESNDARGQFGFPVNFGPQAYHIIRASLVSVFLLDEAQGFRERETTTRADIEKWAKELGAEVMPVVSLKERQFRCGGSTEYIEWVDGLLAKESASELCSLAAFWRGPVETENFADLLVAEAGNTDVIPFPHARKRFSFELVDNPAELDAALSAHHREGKSVRLVASYARDWKTEKIARPHDLPPAMQDFSISWKNPSGLHTWSRIWNWRDAPEGYVSWIDPSPGVPMHANPLAEVGCPYTVRGFDYDYLGILWLSDVVWRKDHWEVNPNTVYESGLRRHIQRAEQETDPLGKHHQALLYKLLQGYRILLSRSLRGMYAWCEDAETKTHLLQCLGS